MTWEVPSSKLNVRLRWRYTSCWRHQSPRCGACTSPVSGGDCQVVDVDVPVVIDVARFVWSATSCRNGRSHREACHPKFAKDFSNVQNVNIAVACNITNIINIATVQSCDSRVNNWRARIANNNCQSRI